MSARQVVGVIITGASRGFGRAIALSFAKSITTHPIHFILTARHTSDLEHTVQLVKEIRSSSSVSPLQDEDRIDTVIADLSDVSTLEQTVSMLFDHTLFHADNNKHYEKLIFVNNAGSLGPLESIGDNKRCTLMDMKSLFDFNITSSSYLTSAFVNRLKSNTNKFSNAHIVNVSSLCAVKAFPTWGTYSAGKAARDMFHQVLAAELTADKIHNIKTLNYAPGPLDTDMQRLVREDEGSDLATRQFYITMKEEGKLIVPEDSANKLYIVLDSNSYDSGSHLDFYDL